MEYYNNDYLIGEQVYGDDVYVDDYYMEERWAFIPGAPGYLVSDMARVWSVKSQSFVKVKPLDNHGHLGVCLYVNGRRIYRYIHRLVAEAFIPNPHNYPIVRHLLDEPRFNSYDELAWGTQRDNAIDAVRNGKNHVITPEERRKGYVDRMTHVEAINKDTGHVLYFESQCEASRVLGIPQANIWKVLRGQRPYAGGYIFREVYDE